MRKLQRYLTIELARNFFISAFFLLALVLIGRGLQLSQTLIGIGLNFKDAALIFVYMSPMFLLIVIPLACMVSIFLSFLRLNTDRELIALKSGGISLYQLLPAPLCFMLLCTALTLSVSLFGISWGMSSFRSTLLEIAQTRARVNIQPGVFNQDIFGLTLFARQVDPVSGKMRQIIFESSTPEQNANGKTEQPDEQGKDIAQDGVKTTFLAPEGSIITDEARGELVFQLKNGKIYRLDGEQLSLLSFEDYSIRLDLSKLFSGGLDLGDVRPKEMPWQELLRIEKEEPEHEFYSKTLIEIQKRLALPVACIVLGIFALPLACSFEGTKQQFGVIIALLMFLAYYALFSLSISVGESGLLDPAIGLWLPNLLFLSAGLAGIYFTARERAPHITLPKLSTLVTLRSRKSTNGSKEQ